MDKLRIRQAVVVEGRYDKNTLSQLIDAPIFVTNGFGIFKDREQMALLRLAALRRGLIVLTDSDGAGLVIRNRIKSCIPPEHLLHAYIPDIPGKEKRKSAPGKEGKLGVEGMKPAVLLAALKTAGATVLEEDRRSTELVGENIAHPRPSVRETGDGAGKAHPSEHAPITKTDLYELGLSGRPDSKARRQALQKQLGLPENLSAGAFLTALNCVYTRDELMNRETSYD